MECALHHRFLLHAGLKSTESVSYAFGINATGHLIHLHWGDSLTEIDDLPTTKEVQCHRLRRDRCGELTSRQEFPSWGGQHYEEPLLKVSYGDGNDSVELKYEAHEQNGEHDLVVHMSDPHNPALSVFLHYHVYDDVPVIDRWVEIVNSSDDPIRLERALSASLHLPTNSDYQLTSLHGKPFGESQVDRQRISHPTLTLESRSGMSGTFSTPYFACDETVAPATQSGGRVWFGTLHWSGNWKITARRDTYGQTSINAGLHDFDFGWTLAPGERFETPRLTIGYVRNSGFNGAGNVLHQYQLHHVLPADQIGRPTPIIVNTWASYGTDVNEANLLNLSDRASRIGAELLVIDDGWQTSLGDWTPDAIKFPNGLKPIIELTRERGIELGLWIEIESCEINGHLHKAHPEWLMRLPGREPHTHYRPDVDRYSALLNFAIDEVADYFIQQIDTLIHETGIRYLKLDMNYLFSEPGWPEVAPVKRQEIWVRYTRNIYRVFEQISSKHPDVLMENCASGAGRSDYGMNRYFGRMNRSDNQDALDALCMHAGYTLMHHPRLAGGGCNISDGMTFLNHRQPPNTFQALVGMMGSLSIGKKLPECTEEELQELRGYTDLFRQQVRPITQEKFGSFHRLVSLDEERFAAFQFVSADKTEALVFFFSHGLQFFRKLSPVRLSGLNADKHYEAQVILTTPEDLDQADATPQMPMTRTGNAWMSLGLRVDLFGDFDCRLVQLRAVG